MAGVLKHDRHTKLLAERPWWQQQSRSLVLNLLVPDRNTAITLLDRIRACVPDRGNVSVCSELRGTELCVQLRCPGHVGLTDDALALMCGIDDVVAALVGGQPPQFPAWPGTAVHRNRPLPAGECADLRQGR